MSIPFERDEDRAAIKSWCEALQSLDPWKRAHAAFELGCMNAHEVIEPLSTALTDRDLRVRVAAACALARQGELARVLSSQSTASVRIEAIMAVTSKKPSLPALITALQDTDSVARARIAAANQLASLGDWTAIAPLLAAAHDPNPRVREKMAQALHRLVHRLNTQKNRILFTFWVDKLVSSLKDDLLYEASLSVLVKIERGELSGTTIKPLVELLHSQVASASEREHIVDVLGESGQRAAVEPLCTALQDNHPDIRMKAALWSLTQLGDRTAAGPLVDLLHRSRSVYEFESIAYDVLPILKNTGRYWSKEAMNQQEDMIQHQIVQLKSWSALKRYHAAKALEPYSHDQRVIEALLECLENKHPAHLDAYYVGTEFKEDADNDLVLSTIANMLGSISVHQALTQPVVNQLLAFFQEKSLSSRPYIATALGNTGDTRVLGPLVDALEEEDPSVVSSAAAALGQLKDRRAIDPLIQTLQKPFQKPNPFQGHDMLDISPMIGNTAYALGHFGDTRAVEPLIQALEQALAPHQRFLFDDVRKIVQALVRLKDHRAVAPLMQVLQGISKYRTSKSLIIQALGDLEAVEAIELIIPHLENEVSVDREAAASALGKLGAVQAIEPLIAHLHDYQDTPFSLVKDTSAAVRAAAASALGKLGAVQAIEPLISCLQDRNRSVQRSAARALGELGAAEAIEPLSASLAQDIYLNIHTDCVEALGMLGAVEPLIDFVQKSGSANHDLAIKILGELGAVEAVDPIIACLQDTNIEIRKAAVQALGQLGDNRAIIPLTRSLQDPEESVRYQARGSLQKLGASPT